MDNGVEALLTAMLLLAVLLIFWRILVGFVLLAIGIVFMVGLLQLASWFSQLS